MHLKPYFLSLSAAERASLAESCRTSVKHLQNVAYGKRCGESLAILIEKNSGRKVTCEELRPDVEWAVIRCQNCAV